MPINAIVCFISKNKKNKMFIILSVSHTLRGTRSRITPSSFSLFVPALGTFVAKGKGIRGKATQGPHLFASQNSIFNMGWVLILLSLFPQ